MNSLYKFLFFFALGGAFFVAAFICYRFFNRRLRESRRSAGFLANAFLLLLANVILLLGAFLAVLRLYGWLSQGND